MTPINTIMEQGQTATNVVLSCVVSGWASDLNKCNQVSWVDIGQDYSPAPIYTGNYQAELTIPSSTVDTTYTCRCDRSVVDNINVLVYLDFVGKLNKFPKRLFNEHPKKKQENNKNGIVGNVKIYFRCNRRGQIRSNEWRH